MKQSSQTKHPIHLFRFTIRLVRTIVVLIGISVYAKEKSTRKEDVT